MLNQLLANYPAPYGSFDELRETVSQPRAHWRTLVESLAGETPDLIQKRMDSVERQVRENGVTYNIYADDKGMQRPWDLNVLPMILPHDEWAGIEAAVIQRATLMNQLLIDVYGEQKMLQERMVPPALIHGHAGFLRPCHGVQHKSGVALHFYAVDMARAPNGRWWAVADRTQAPSGAGYALENRAVIARTFPDLLHDLGVRHLTGFFSAMQDSLVAWGRQCAANGTSPGLPEGALPLIVLLTPGPYNETYYEQSYLARYLGLPLVEGSDLTVRDGMVWHKSLSGLQRVHVVVRRVDDDYCDPLELRNDSALGVAGLIDAARRGNVLVANSLGSSLLESGALLGFLPGLCKRLLGAPLKMPSVATWWCGEPVALEEVVRRLDQLVIKPSFPQLREFPVFGKDLTGSARTAFIAKLRANPQNYVAQELVRLSTAPVWTSGTPGCLGAAAIGLRVYACATTTGYIVMPGGLTRVATGPDARIITMQRGGSSKDTWIQASAQAAVHGLPKRVVAARDLVRDDSHLSSRVAENLFWFGRNMERCDNTARLLRVSLGQLVNRVADNQGSEWPTIVALCESCCLLKNGIAALSIPKPPIQAAFLVQGRATGMPPERVIANLSTMDARVEAALLQAVVSPDVPGLARQQQQLYRSASQLRERLSVDNWRAINQMVQTLAISAKHLGKAEAMGLLDSATTALMTMAGFALDGMTRDMGWQFLSLGRRIERLQWQCMALEHGLQMQANGKLDWLLELADCTITYRARYRAQPEWLPLLDLLLLDGTNTRSVVFQLQAIHESLEKIGLIYGPSGNHDLPQLEAELLELDARTCLDNTNPRLVNLLGRIRQASGAMSDQIGLQYFSYSGVTGNTADALATA